MMHHHTPLIKDQPIASSGCSIPSRYQTFIVDNSDQKGFNSGTRRFQNVDISDTPGPGHYNQVNRMISTKNQALNKPRKRGPDKSYSEIVIRNANTTGLISRFQTPGPNNYNVAKPLSMRKDHHRANSSSFQSVRRNGKHFETPAPNMYEPKAPETQSISSCFRSTSKRSGTIVDKSKPNQRVPSPTHYLLRDKMTKTNPRAPTSCFLSTTNRSEISYKTAKGAFYADTSATTNNIPGPGSYGNISRWANPVDDRLHRRGHYLAISAPAIPLPPSKSLPGPGEYELVDYNGPNKQPRSSSMFSSNTDRWNKEQRYAYVSKGLPGPASYNPKGIKKQSFIFNAERRWIN